MKRIAIIVSAAVLLLIGTGLVLLRPSGSDPASATAASGSPSPDSAEAKAARRAITEDPVAPQVAPKGHTATIVVYFDYQCPYCRKLHPVLKAAMAQDPKLRVVYRDWPIFGPASTEAARAAIASKYQGKHAAFDDALMATQGKLSSATIRAAATKAGVNWTRLQADLKAHSSEIDALLDRSSRQAAMLGLQGTPGLLIGPYLVPGALDLGELRKAIAMARANPEGRPDGE